MTKLNNDPNRQLYSFGILYTIAIVCIAAIANYFTWNIVYESSIVNWMIFFLSIVMWVALYVPLPTFIRKANWKLRDFGFVFNTSTVIISLGLSILIIIRLAGTFTFEFLNYTILEAFARVGEELFFRGFLYTLVIKLFKGSRKASLWAIIITSVAFAIMHTQTFLPTNPLRMGDIFISSIIFAIVRCFTGSILPSIIVHLAGNSGILGMSLGILLYCLFILVPSFIKRKLN